MSWWILSITSHKLVSWKNLCDIVHSNKSFISILEAEMPVLPLVTTFINFFIHYFFSYGHCMTYSTTVVAYALKYASIYELGYLVSLQHQVQKLSQWFKIMGKVKQNYKVMVSDLEVKNYDLLFALVIIFKLLFFFLLEIFICTKGLNEEKEGWSRGLLFALFDHKYIFSSFVSASIYLYQL